MYRKVGRASPSFSTDFSVFRLTEFTVQRSKQGLVLLGHVRGLVFVHYIDWILAYRRTLFG